MISDHHQKQGVAMVIVVISMIAAAVIGTAVLSMATSLRFERVNLGISARAYYLAESGANFVRAVREVDRTALPLGVYTLVNGDQFQVTTLTNESGEVLVHSIGIANPGSHLEARRSLRFNIRHRVDPSVLDLGFDNDGDGQLDDEWQFTAEGTGNTGRPEMGTAPEGGEALMMNSWMGNFHLNWQINPALDLVQAWSNNHRLLSYDVQAKVSAAKHDGYTNSPAFNAVLLVGIGFRLQNDRLSSYGVSFFRRNPAFSRYAPWTNDLSRTFLTTLSNTNVYLTLWSRVYPGKREVLAYKRITPPGLLHPSPIRAGQFDIKPFSTILINIEEDYVGATTNRVNKIKVYTQSTNDYNRWPDGIQNYSHAQWQDNTNLFPAPVTWDYPSGRTVMTNNLFTSGRFHLDKPPEINLHVYDFAEKFFDDFVMRVEGFVSPSSPGGQLQY